MNSGTLTIYSASAGSGKTFQLAKIYLTHLFKGKYNYRKILAVTFTNKATAEMKSRILHQLYSLANGEKSEYLEDLIRDTGKSEEMIRSEAGEILFSILHDFSRFSISTIDAFFQKVIRSFARETGLQSGFNVELDHTMILSDAIDKMIASSAGDREVKEWLTDYVMRNLEEEKSWNLKSEITKLAEELFKEKYKILSESEREKLEDKLFLRNYIKNIRDLISSTEKRTEEFGKELESVYSGYGLTDEMFYQKSKGIPGFIRLLAAGKIIKPNNNVRLILGDNPRWSTKDPPPKLVNAIKGGLEKILREAINFCDDNFRVYNTAKALAASIYALGILSDVLGKVRQVASDGNSFLISDAGELLSLITGQDQTPFIYEKIGNVYGNYMIDEFQDTSFLQWKNFQPLILESLGRGFNNLIVGDIKQSIYRWRNSDWQILEDLQNNQTGKGRIYTVPLDKNWRSRPDIIRFNNALFSVIPLKADMTFNESGISTNFGNLYEGAVQTDPGKSEGGYVKLEFITQSRPDTNEKDASEDERAGRKWKETVLDKIPGVIEMFQDHGYLAGDIGIIVREVKEGEEIVRRMIDYANNCSSENKSRYNYGVVSDDSLTLSSSNAIMFIISVIKVLCDPDDIISRAEMFRFFGLNTRQSDAGGVDLLREGLMDTLLRYFPEGSMQFLGKVRNSPLFEVTESIISFFGLDTSTENVPYLDTFQDQILNFSRNRNSDADSFLEWWETTGRKKSISLPANQDSARVLTIHKAKGLEFKVVILPFLSWNLDHSGTKQPWLWVKPSCSPFDEMGIVPVKYGKYLTETLFAEEYFREKYYSFIDNINLLYVAMTRAKDAIYGFVPDTGGKSASVSRLLKDALCSAENPAGDKGMILNNVFDIAGGVFEFGTISGAVSGQRESRMIFYGSYRVNKRPESVRLRLHGENYLTSPGQDKVRRINYGNLMHEVFGGIDTARDIPVVLKKMLREGKITEPDYLILEKRLFSLVGLPEVSEWFAPGLKVLKESEILSPSGNTRRPDRVIIRDDKAIVIDFKFGEENPKYSEQAVQYRNLLLEMGYNNVDAYLWYADKNKIVAV